MVGQEIGPRIKSLPSRGRGLKFFICLILIIMALVAPFTGAWIEISFTDYMRRTKDVAPFTGAWIEIYNVLYR